MIAAALAARARQEPQREFLAGPGARISYGEAWERAEGLAKALAWAGGARVAVAAPASEEVVLQLLALDRAGARAHLLPPDLQPGARAALEERLAIDATLGPGEREPGCAVRSEPVPPGEVVLFTSGTTALPKAALHTWRSLAARVRVAPDLEDSRWLLTYALSAFAGVQVLLHVLHNGARLTLGDGPPAALAELGARDGVTHVSGTPTFFRFLLATAPADLLDRLPLRQVTLGGEAVDQPVLDALRERFPSARLTHIYASTEMGACFSVHDGRAGFPASYLESEALPAFLRVVDGELWIRSPHGMRGYLEEAEPLEGGFFRTGDLVELRGDRVHFLGRRSERINVGGSKVYPREVEEVVLEVAGVRAVRVSALPSSLMGQLVAADVVREAEAEAGALRAAILSHCRDRLAPHKVPRRLRFVDRLEGTASGKLARR